MPFLLRLKLTFIRKLVNFADWFLIDFYKLNLIFIWGRFMHTRKKNSKIKKTETNTEWLDKVINQLTNKDFSQYL